MTETASLTRAEAGERAALLSVRRYDITVDLTGLLEGETVESTATITFDCATPGASSFVDCVAEIQHATLNGIELDPATASAGRLPLTDLKAENVLVVAAAQADTGHGAGILRTVDPSDKLVYVWMSFEADDARRVWACFDQPDLKAPHRFTVTAPASWTVTSNGAPVSVESVDDSARVWSFPDTPSLSTYVVVINAGPFHEIRRAVDGFDLGLYSRQSTARYLERDAEELFDLTARGLAFFGERFAMPFPQARYDQVFVPNMGGAMENWGCVTWTDAVLFRGAPTYAQRHQRAEVLLHEMAHMWFGDLVTMQWWDDLWLNEAFASWASTWASVHATEFTDGWATFLATLKLEGYRMDLGPASHPIRGDVPNVDAAMASFDAITYIKGESVLKQLVAHVGEDAFVRGLRDYFARHAWGNTSLEDLMTAVGDAAGTDVTDWTTAWFDRAGTDLISLQDERVVVTSPDSGPPRPHTLVIGSYDDAPGGGDHPGSLALRASTTVRTSTDSVPVELPEAVLHLVNDEDLTFAAVRPDAASLRSLLDRAGDLPTPTGRALAVATVWNLMMRGRLGSAEVMRTLLGVLDRERSAGIVEPFLALARACAEDWAPEGDVARHRGALADVASRLAEEPELRIQAWQALAGSATTPEHFAALGAAVQDDLDLGWRVLTRRAELGDYDEAATTALLDRDPDPDAATRALGVRAARPLAEAKEEAWAAVFHERSVHVGMPLRQLASCFWRPGQAVLEPFPARYLDEVRSFGHGGLLELGSMVNAMMPRRADEDFVAAARELAQSPGTPPYQRAPLLTGADTLERKLRVQRDDLSD